MYNLMYSSNWCIEINLMYGIRIVSFLMPASNINIFKSAGLKHQSKSRSISGHTDLHFLVNAHTRVLRRNVVWFPNFGHLGARRGSQITHALNSYTFGPPTVSIFVLWYIDRSHDTILWQGTRQIDVGPPQWHFMRLRQAKKCHFRGRVVLPGTAVTLFDTREK